MKQTEKEEIREAVRRNYADVAEAGWVGIQEGGQRACCSTGAGACGGERVPCGSVGNEEGIRRLSSAMGYSGEDMESVPAGANMGLGCGNPTALASLKPGETVLDLGSGGGFDCFLAAKKVGKTGRVIGVDMTADMVSKARRNAEKIGADNVEFRLGEIEHLPVADSSVDVILSNCVVNLSPEKGAVYRDAIRVLRPGGRICISDILATGPLPEEILGDLALVSACIGGAATSADTEAFLRDAGFEDIRITPSERGKELLMQWDPEKAETIGSLLTSATIEAKKPL